MSLAAARLRAVLAPLLTLLVLMGLWFAATSGKPSPLFPSPSEVWAAFVKENATGRLWNDAVSSLYRVGVGFGLATLIGLPLGMVLGHSLLARQALLPLVNFLRNISPIAWIPFAIAWFKIGDEAVIFLIFLASFPPIVLAAIAAVLGAPQIYFRVGREYGLTGFARLRGVTLPAILPQVVTSLRVTVGLAWLVVVAAEMVSRSDQGGLGFLILDARNGQMPDLVMVGMILIGTIGVILDRMLMVLTWIPSVRWGYER